MAFHTNVFRNGEWVTETVNLHAVLKAHKPAPKAAARIDAVKPPRCGLLTTTVMESARPNLLLPVRIRSPDHNDIAFVGDHFVQISELRKDGRIEEIVRKNDFGCRIRNACVVGSFVVPDLNDERSADPFSPSIVKTEHDAPSQYGSARVRPFSSGASLPPQLLAVVLETGATVFLFVRHGPDGRPEFVASRCQYPRRPDPYLGFHMAVDPSSRYMALAGPANSFIVYELASHGQLSEAYGRGEPLRPVRSFRLRGIQGVIHKLTFLHPRLGDDRHIILLLVIVRHGKSRTVIYDWELGEDLKTVFAEEKQGHRLPVEHQMPLIIIPLTVQSAFVSISEHQIAVCTECLHGPPKFESIDVKAPPPTANHRGCHQPLWTAWARPFRLQTYSKSRDCVYLAREDGVVVFLEAEQDNALARSTVMDTFPCGISTAFACLFDDSTDVLVLGSDSGPGGHWKIPPRKPIELLGVLPSWSPVVDMTTTDEFSTWHPEVHQDKAMVPWQQAKMRKPDRVFATCETGCKGAITEYRCGLKAHIGLDLDYGASVKQAWLLPGLYPAQPDGYLLVLSMPDSSAALNLAGDFSSADPPAPDTIPFDLSSTTLALARSGQSAVQITTQKIVLSTPHQSAQFAFEALPGLANASVSDACTLDDCIAISAHTDAQFQIHVFKADFDNFTLALVQAVDVDGEVTCLALGTNYTLLAGIRRGSEIFLASASLQHASGGLGLEMVNLTEYVTEKDESLGLDLGAVSALEGVASIVSVGDVVFLGTRSGEVMTVTQSAGSLSIDCEKFGRTTANVSAGHRAGAPGPSILVSCDDSLISVSLDHRSSHGGSSSVHRTTKLRVWPVDASKLETPAPPVHYAAAVDMPADDGITPILIVSGSRLLLAEMNHAPGPAHRIIPVNGTPNRVIYCQFTQCLVAAVNWYGGPGLAFINPDTGDYIGRPMDKNGEPQSNIAGLGKAGDRILGLAEWNYRRDGNVWNFILVSTKSGRLVLVSTQKVKAGEDGPTSIRYWTQFWKEVKGPMYAVFGYDHGLVYCYGQTIQWEVLDVQEKKLKPIMSVPLGSPATALRLSSGKLAVLTTRESLIILDSVPKNATNNNDNPQDDDDDDDNEDEARVDKICHIDPWRRNAVDFIEIAGPQLDDPRSGLFLVADREGGVAALWVPRQTPDRECEVVVEAELPYSIRRLRRGRTRPAWEQRRAPHAGAQPRYGRLPATVDDAEILGISLHGSLHRFTLLSVDAWRLLRFVQNLALASEAVCPFVSPQVLREQRGRDGSPEPRLSYGLDMHVDGDILRRCLERRALEEMVTREGQLARFVELLTALDGGKHVQGLPAAGEGNYAPYFQLAYDILEYHLLSPL
ncbi:83584e03-818d-4b11-90c2-03de08d0c3f1 [Thermothielavioides terrestris]|uniref:83584e03-818d-4b11-90c2-03de08d0c3f1 n=1 Tax=Thermothielavioides terrestris TaxID=2587410 RepID=A0A446BMH7_9PEZI|nr:83584e03-818d-4b11-90c2-03de08d0c3f1 [Thermothielavioides terrestris]